MDAMEMCWARLDSAPHRWAHEHNGNGWKCCRCESKNLLRRLRFPNEERKESRGKDKVETVDDDDGQRRRVNHVLCIECAHSYFLVRYYWIAVHTSEMLRRLEMSARNFIENGCVYYALMCLGHIVVCVLEYESKRFPLCEHCLVEFDARRMESTEIHLFSMASLAAVPCCSLVVARCYEHSPFFPSIVHALISYILWHSIRAIWMMSARACMFSLSNRILFLCWQWAVCMVCVSEWTKSNFLIFFFFG